MRKSGGYLLLVLLGLAVVGISAFSYFAFFGDDVEVMFAPPQPYFPESCENEQLFQMWESVFLEGSGGVQVVVDGEGTDGRCEDFLVWKRNVFTDNFTYFLVGDMNSFFDSSIYSDLTFRNVSKGWFFWGNYTEVVNESFFDEISDAADFNWLVNELEENVDDYALEWGAEIEPDAVFLEKFGYENETAFFEFGPYYWVDYEEKSSEEVPDSNWTINYTTELIGGVGIDNQTAFFYYTDALDMVCDWDFSCTEWANCNGTAENRTCTEMDGCFDNVYVEWQPCGSACVTNWTLVNNTACDSETESHLLWWRDENDCENATAPANITEYCDYDENGLIGDIDDLNDVNLDIDIVLIDDEEINYSGNYTGDEEVILVEDDDGDEYNRVRFDFDFDEGALNFHNIRIERQDTDDDYGYLIVQGLEDISNKEFWVDVVDDSGAVCVRDEEIDSEGDIGDNCDDSSETYLLCPGDQDGYECDTNTSGFYRITNLDNSGVKETSFYDGPPPGCQPNWTVGNWGSCLNGNRSRVWTDQNNCPNSTGTSYTQYEVCQSDDPDDCQASFTCEDWFPSDLDCEPGEEQNRTCVDQNGCEDERVEMKTCEEDDEGGVDWLLILLIGVGVLIVVVAIVLIIMVKKKREEEPDFNQKDPINVLTKPPAGSYGKTHYGSKGGSYNSSYGGYRGGGGAYGSSGTGGYRR